MACTFSLTLEQNHSNKLVFHFIVIVVTKGTWILQVTTLLHFFLRTTILTSNDLFQQSYMKYMLDPVEVGGANVS